MNLDGLPAGMQTLLAAAGPSFQQVSVLRFAPGAGADGFTIDAAGTHLKGSFAPYEYDALAAGEPVLRAGVRTAGGALLVTLPAPRQVRRVTLAGVNAGTVELYRVDGQQPLGDAVASAGNHQWLPNEFTAAGFAIRLRTESGSLRPLAAGDLTGLWVRSYPATPRLALLTQPDPAQPPALTVFWQQAGEVGRVAPAAPPDRARVDVAILAGTAVERVSASAAGGRGVAVRAGDQLAAHARLDPAGGFRSLPVDASAALAAALAGYLASLPAPLAGDVTASLVIAADAPCMFTVEQAAVRYHLLRTAWPGGAAKQVLRFAGERAAGQTLPIRLPGGAAIAAATVDLLPSLRPGRLAGSAQPARLSGELGGPDGAIVDGESWLGWRFTPGQGAVAVGVAVGLLALRSGTQLLLELQEDHQGLPSGKRLAGATLALPAAGERLWATARFAAGLALPPQPHWLLLKAAQGQAVWLAEAADGEALEGLERSDPTSAWRRLRTAAGLQPRLRWLLRDTPAAPVLGVAVGDRPVALAPVQPGAPGAQQDELLRGDLATALAAYLNPGPAGQPVDIPLIFTAAGPGLITVYPPRIEYDI
jgi:hypothetical protein